MARSNKERTEQTRADLIAAGRKLFVEKGYADTATPDIVSATGLTRGALYHHFADKRALLYAIVDAEAALVAEAIEEAAPRGATPRKELMRGGEAFLDAMRVPGRARLLLLEGPTVLGPAIMAEIDKRHGGGTLQIGLERAAEAGMLPAETAISELSALLSAAYDRAALDIEAGGDDERHRRALAQLLNGLLRG